MHELDTAVKIAVACAQGPGEAGAMVALRALRQVVPFECAELSCWDPAAGHHWTVGNLDYPPQVMKWFSGEPYARELAWLGMRRRSTAFRMRDMPCELDEVPGITDVLWPSGFAEGMTITLFDGHDRYLGVLNLSTASRKHPTDDARRTIIQLAPALATLLDWSRALHRLAVSLDGDGTTVVLALRRDGRLEPIDGAGTDPAEGAGPDTASAGDGRREPIDPAEVARLGAALTRGGVVAGDATRSFLWPLGRDRWWRVVLRPLPAGAAPGIAALVTARAGTAPYGLSRREVEILTLLAQGLTSARAATYLWISERTVNTHVDHILAKLRAPGRGAATARAVAEGLLLPYVSPTG